MRTIAIFLCLAILFTSCEKEKCKVDRDVASIPVNVEINRLEREMFSIEDEAGMIDFLNRYPGFAEHFLERAQYPDDAILAARMLDLVNDPYIDTLYRETQLLFGDMADLKEQFKLAFQHIKSYYPDFKPPVIYTAITGMGNDVYVSDDMIVIGLDFFLGEGATYRPAELPKYILKRYQKEYIAPTVILAMSNKYNRTNPEDKTMLADMIFYGKAYYFTKKMLPCTADSLIIGYSGVEIEDAHENAGIIWANFIENELLFETSHFMKNKFLGERPKVQEIGSKCPGRIGTWVGWEIINKYVEKTGADFKDLMNDGNAREIFSKSKYRGR